MKRFYTYLHCKPDGEPFYVGKGTSHKKHGERCLEFFSNRSKYHSNIVNKYGKDNILVYKFYCDTEEQAYSDEIQQIANLRFQGYELCNLTKGGDGIRGLKHTDAAKLKIAQSRIGTKVSDETKAKMAAWHKGKIVSEETRKRLSESGKKYWESRRSGADSQYGRKSRRSQPEA